MLYTTKTAILLTFPPEAIVLINCYTKCKNHKTNKEIRKHFSTFLKESNFLYHQNSCITSCVPPFPKGENAAETLAIMSFSFKCSGLHAISCAESLQGSCIFFRFLLETKHGRFKVLKLMINKIHTKTKPWKNWGNMSQE